MGPKRQWKVDYFVGTSDDARELVRSLLLTFNHGLEYARMIGPEVHEAMGDAGLFVLISLVLHCGSPDL